VLAHHRLRRLWNGVYHQKPFRFSLFTLDSPEQRVEGAAEKPTFRWRW